MAAPVIDSTLAVGALLGAAFSYAITATNSPTSYSATPLPAGLTLDSTAGILSGTPLVAGTPSIAIGATNTDGTGTATLVVTISSGVPVINTTTSVLGYDQNESWEYQPWASNTPTGWSATGLPAGMSIDGTTGLISGAATVAGVFVAGIVATNGAGQSAPLNITIGIAPSSAQATLGIDATIDMDSGVFTFLNGAVQLKQDDDIILFIQFMKGGNVVDPGAISAVSWAFKEFEPDGDLEVATAFHKSGSGTGAVLIIYGKIDPANFAAALSNYEADTGTSFQGLMEIEWIMPNPVSGAPGPTTLRRSTQIFTAPIVRQLTPA